MSLERPPATTPALYAQEKAGPGGAVVHAHYFIGANDWLVTEYDPATDIAFGWACLNGDRQNAELGYVSLAELEEVAVQQVVRIHTLSGDEAGEGSIREVVLPLHVEREEDWTPCTIREAVALLDERQGRV